MDASPHVTPARSPANHSPTCQNCYKCTSPRKRMKLTPIGVACIHSPTKVKKTPQKNTLLNYFTSPTKESCKKNLANTVFTHPSCSENNTETNEETMNNLANQSLNKVEKPIHMAPMQQQDGNLYVLDSTPSTSGLQTIRVSSDVTVLDVNISSDDDIDDCEILEQLHEMETEQKRKASKCQGEEVDVATYQHSSEVLEEVNICSQIYFSEPDVYGVDDELDVFENVKIDDIEEEKNELEPHVVEEIRKCSDLFLNEPDIVEEPKNKSDAIKEFKCQINSLPDEILEAIFCQLPFQKLCAELTHVCTRWNEVISNAKFIPWKKRYFRIKAEDEVVKQQIVQFCALHRMTDECCLLELIRFMKAFFSFAQSEQLLKHIKKHPKYEWAFSLLSERVGECIEDEVPFLGSVIASLCILCSDVRELLLILAHLTHHSTDFSVVRILECLYCILTFLFYFKMQSFTNPGYHYRLYYALQSFESSGQDTVSDLTTIPTTSSGQQTTCKSTSSDAKVSYTHEQMRIINHSMGPNQTVKIIAFAGTGKTTTLVELTKRWPSLKFLNVCYNKSVQQNAERLFPRNVTCKTMHSLAYSSVGKEYQKWGKWGQLYPMSYMQFLNGNLIRSGIALKTIENYICTADDDITTAHVPNGRRKKEDDEFVTYSIEEKIVYRDDAETLWAAMRDKKNEKAKISHDVYFKLYQLKKPSILGYDCILIDEAQDFNGAMMDVLVRQSCPKIFVGDPNQQIYAFRGAVNTLTTLQATHLYYLSISHRFGPEIGYIASCALETMKNVHNKTIVGGLQKGTITGAVKGQVAYIARTNYSLFAEAVRVCCNTNENIRGAFIGTLQSYDYNDLIAIHSLVRKSNGEGVWIKNKFIAKFKGLDELRHYAENVQDSNLLGKIRIVETYNRQIPFYVETIERCCQYDIAEADVVFTTTHKAKGHEFETVRLSNDFIEGQIDQFLKFRNIDSDEANLLYVAITRAKRSLILSTPLIEMLLASGERFEFLHCTRFWDKGWFDDVGNWSCIRCSKSSSLLAEGNFIIERQHIMNSGGVIRGGPLCSLCSTCSYMRVQDYSYTWRHNSIVQQGPMCWKSFVVPLTPQGLKADLSNLP